MSEPRRTDLELLRRLSQYLRSFWPHVAGFLLLSLAATPLTLLAPVPLKIVIDHVLGDAPLPAFVTTRVTHAWLEEHLLAAAVGLLLGIAALTQLQRVAASLAYTYLGERIALEFRSRLFRHVQYLSLNHHDMAGSSDSTYRVYWDGAAIRHVALDVVTPFVTSGLTLSAMVYVLFRLDWMLALVALGVTPLLFLLLRVYRERLRERWRDVKQLESAALNVVQETLGAIRVVQAFGQEDRQHARFVRRSRAGLWARLRATGAVEGFDVLVALTTVVGTAVVLLIGVRHVQAGVLTLGDLLVVMAYLASFYAPLKAISKNVGGLQSHLASAERALSLLDQPRGVVEAPDAIPLTRAEGNVSFRRVSFAYPDGTRPLDDVSLEVAAGMRVGIAGRTGAGKTTLMNLLTRFYDPTSGAIQLDGTDLRRYRLADLRGQFGIVLQDPVLFSSTIAENIAYAAPDADMEQVIAAARAADAHEFITRLPHGYDTVVGERGLRLSGGERQRIALARAFLKDSPLLILDEPTSSVDLQTEHDIFSAMERLMQGRTTFLISHRPETLRRCDRLLVIENGSAREHAAVPATAVRRHVAGT